MDQGVKNLPAVQEIEDMWVQSLGSEEPLENEIANHSSISFLKNPMDRRA